MRVLFINPNRYHYPPVIPVGIEYLSASLLSRDIEFSVLDLCFSEAPEDELLRTLNDYLPDIAAITVRQTDTVLYHQNEFFLPAIKKYTGICKSCGCVTVLGGSGFSIMPEQIIEYTGADYGVCGPGEYAFIRLIKSLENGNCEEKILNGYEDFTASAHEFERKIVSDYASYIRNNGIVGFRTQIGCDGKCIFCTESNKRIIFHDPGQVGKEIAMIRKLGYHHFHLCDSEFNLEIEHCTEVCKAIKSVSGPVKWALYMKPEPFDEDLFYWLHQSGADMLTLSMDTQNTGKDYLKMIGDLLFLANKYQLKVAVDLSTGFPYEEMGNAEKMMDFLDKQPVQTVGINFFYRVYPGTGLFDMIRIHPDLERYVIRTSDSESFVFPVFFGFFDLSRMTRMVRDRKKFRIEGFEKATNYQRLGIKDSIK
ncbi:MAG: cobalamin-dependent protein [Bacteroidales bacterium]|nr:cobalamin-dependent protein [Bacteroidales bacterium]